MPDEMNNNFAVIAPDGSVLFTFAGAIHAQGLILDATSIAQSQNDPPESVQWVTPADGIVRAEIRGLDSSDLFMRGLAPDNVGSSFAEVIAARNNGGNLETRVRLLLQHNPPGPAGLKEYIEALVFTDAGALVQRNLLTSGIRSNWVQDFANGTPYASKGLAAASAFWTYAAPPADTSNRFFSSAVNSYFDNGAAVGAGAMAAADGIMYCQDTGVYHITIGVFNSTGGVTGNYAGGRLVRNGTVHYDLLGAHTAATMDTDGLQGGHGSASLILPMTAGEYMRVEGWSQAGFNMYYSQTWFRLPV